MWANQSFAYLNLISKNKFCFFLHGQTLEPALFREAAEAESFSYS